MPAPQVWVENGARQPLRSRPVRWPNGRIISEAALTGTLPGQNPASPLQRVRRLLLLQSPSLVGQPVGKQDFCLQALSESQYPSFFFFS